MDDVAERSPCGNYVRYNDILGRGAFKDVYKAFDEMRHTQIAWNQICVEDETTFNSTDKQEALLSEAVLLKSLDHRNIMKCYSFWLDYNNKSMNMVTELFNFGSLRQYMKKLNSVEEQTIKNWGRQILQGLHHIHTRKPCIIHRDIKCDNIFLDINGEIKIGDFGLATAMEQSSLQVLVGTPKFMAPEYYDEEYNELVDIYAFGMCLMEMATLECPYAECTNPAQIFKKVTTGIKPRAMERVKYPEVKKMIEKCLLPASLRPSALELLNDHFFLPEISTKEDDNICPVDSSTVSDSLDESVLSGISTLFNSIENMEESVLSGISSLYNSISLSDAYPDKVPGACYPSSSGDVSMDSRITFASSSA